MNGKKHGEGKIKFKDGAVYKGYWENDIEIGAAVYKSKLGSSIVG